MLLQKPGRAFKILQVREHTKFSKSVVAGIEDIQTGEQFLFDVEYLKPTYKGDPNHGRKGV